MEWVKYADRKPTNSGEYVVYNHKGYMGSQLATYDSQRDVFVAAHPGTRPLFTLDVSHWIEIPRLELAPGPAPFWEEE